jgi:hypothetical protein
VITVATDEVTPSRTAVAVIDAVPGAFAVTSPVAAFTVAIVGSLLAHVIVRPAMTVLDASNSVAVSCTVGVVATLRVAVGGAI